MKHLRIIRYVDEVARSGSIRKAAVHLNVTASAVNRRIMDLEDELGTPLFERRSRGVRLTAAGDVVPIAPHEAAPLLPSRDRQSRPNSR
jgi:DNA-binding transcriptional LysR family regulator